MPGKVISLDFSVFEMSCRLVHVNSELHSAPGRNFYPHHHSTMELHYVFAGRCSITMDNIQHHVDAGQLLLIPPGLYHYVSDTSPDLARITIAIQFEPPASCHRESLAPRIFAALSPSAPLLLNIPPDSPPADVLSRMHTLPLSSGAVTLEKLRALSQLLVLELFDILTHTQAVSLPVSVSPPAPQDFVIDEFFVHSFRLNNGSPILARKLHVSTRQLQRIIKQSYGMNYRDKLKEVRLQIALDLLSRTDKSIAQIAQQLGYSSSANFSAFIKSTTGKTPSQLRRETQMLP